VSRGSGLLFCVHLFPGFLQDPGGRLLTTDELVYDQQVRRRRFCFSIKNTRFAFNAFVVRYGALNRVDTTSSGDKAHKCHAFSRPPVSDHPARGVAGARRDLWEVRGCEQHDGCVSRYPTALRVGADFRPSNSRSSFTSFVRDKVIVSASGPAVPWVIVCNARGGKFDSSHGLVSGRLFVHRIATKDKAGRHHTQRDARDLEHHRIFLESGSWQECAPCRAQNKQARR
jgi:hypothetical protein